MEDNQEKAHYQDTRGLGLGVLGYIGNALLENKGMYGYNVTNSSDESTKTTSTTNVSNIATANHAKTGNGYANIQYISYAYAENIKINGENLKNFNPETLEYTIEISKSI